MEHEEVGLEVWAMLQLVCATLTVRLPTGKELMEEKMRSKYNHQTASLNQNKSFHRNFDQCMNGRNSWFIELNGSRELPAEWFNPECKLVGHAHVKNRVVLLDTKNLRLFLHW